MKAVVTILLVVAIGYIPCVSPCRPCRDHKPPVLARPCPGDIQVHADACSNSTVVHWTDPLAKPEHDHCGSATVRRVDHNPNSGCKFNVHESPYVIKYSATDKYGNTNGHLCSFVINVKAIQCPDPYPNLPDNSTNCTDGFNYKSVCSYICPPGYSLLSNSERVCEACKMWTGSETPVCNDTQRPVINCPGTILAYAESGQTTATVTWDLPTVTDNSNEELTAEQIEGLPPGADFSSGSLGIKYEVSDSSGNTATCSFNVVVQG